MINDNQLKELKQATKEIPKFSLNGVNTICKVVDVYDGDTVKVVFFTKDELYKWTIRMYGINTPEMRPSLKNPNRDSIIQNAKQSKMYLISKLKEKDFIVYIKCFGFDKYGRLLGELYPDDKYELSYNTLMINEGYADIYK